MAESVHGTGSAISNSCNGRTKYPKNSRRKYKKKKRAQSNYHKKRSHAKRWIKGIIAIGIIIVVFLVFMNLIRKYAVSNNCGSAFWNFVSDTGVQIVFGGGFFDAIISLGLAYLRDKKIILEVFWGFFLGILVVILAFVCFFAYSGVEGAISQKKEAKVEKEINDADSGSVAQLDRGSQSAQKTTVAYVIKDDLYMNDRPLEDYYAGEISEENEKNVRAEILLKNLKENLPVKNQLDNYNELLFTADKNYKTYLYQRELTKDSENDNDMLFSDRIETFQKSLNRRGEANKKCEDPENERLLANGYKDMGDEYFGREKQNDAIEAYENGVEWYMKAIYHAAAIGDYVEMEKSMELFDKLGKEVEKLDEIDLNRREKIKTLIEVYAIFVDKVLEEL